jgi:hypothetical protein
VSVNLVGSTRHRLRMDHIGRLGMPLAAAMRWKWRQGTGTYVFLQAFDRLKRRSRRAGGAAESSTARFAWRGLLRATNPELSLASSVCVLVRYECDEESCRT